MDTKWKKGKIIRSFLYRILAVGALFATIGTGILGREALTNMYREGSGTLSGKVYYLTEFREYLTLLYTQGMLGYAGIGDDKGHPLTDEKAIELSAQFREDFAKEVRFAGEGLLYYVEYKGEVMDTNITYPIFSENDDHLMFPDQLDLCLYWNGQTGRLLAFSGQTNRTWHPSLEEYYKPQYTPVSTETQNIKLLLAVDETLFSYNNYTDNYLSLLATLAQRSRNTLIAFCISAAATLLFGFFSLVTVKAGRQAKKEYLRLIAKLWLEIRIVIIGVLFYICHTCNLWNFLYNRNQRLVISANWGLYIPMGIVLYLACLNLTANGLEVWKQTLLYTIYHRFREYSKSLPWYRKALTVYYIIRVSSLVLLATGLLLIPYGWMSANGTMRIYTWSRILWYCGPFPFILALILGILLFGASLRFKRFMVDALAITHKIANISTGENSQPLLLPETSLLYQAAEDLNTAGNGIEAAIEQNNRSNKMRVELLTNVSHDLKTPLTSIINYADLLCEENLPAPACEYAASLRNKAYRLKGMVQDVFDLSKATSGNLTIEKTRLDLAKLVRQTLADMDERIQESTLQFKVTIASEPIMIEADGEKLYRVFQNLIVNALQYSLDYSRVHVQLETRDGLAFARIKNTSRQELNFSAEEIVERFVRADTSRTSEGSGLGLSIVQSFTESCGGSFRIEMDADLFTACVVFPLIPEIDIQP